MKEKFLQLKERIMQNKKKAAAIGIAVLLLIGAGGYGIVALNMNNEETVKAEQVSEKTTAKKTNKDVTDKKIATDKKTEDKKSSSDKKEVKKNEVEKKEDKKEAAKGNSEKPVDKSSTDTSKPAENTSTGSTGNSNTGNNSSQGSGTVTQPSTPKPEPTPQPEPDPDPEPPAHVCSFDIPIWSEKDETAMVPVWYCNTCGEEVGDPETHLDETMHAGYRNTWEERPTGNKIPYISGYQCSCGAVQ